VPLPHALPQVAWRAGLDIEPVDVTDDDAVRWLELLIWPGEEDRVETLHAAVEVARRDPPRVVRGDLSTDLPALAAEAPKDATLVVFHTAVLWYVPSEGRERFHAARRTLDAVWIANEDPRVLDLPRGKPDHLALAQDGRQVAWADGHGKWLRWL
jgi:hypothetical protein